ncbi:hypothetical protein OE88DRAFT_1352823 [Heliocybe sulcata]|uniref:Uncharacterized protein n=1 Tax=Heliocybe sulcata TaxID=5364 RepID=A0A5C3N7F8_9AGAM|nr:hypothetical protein OE88DRAFT_1352823 [Heliocybe sulcata]
MSSIHAQRAKRWDTNPWQAERLANAFDYCHKTDEGRHALRAGRSLRTYGPQESRKKLEACAAPARRKYGTPYGNAKTWNEAAVEFGISYEAMKLYHEFTALNELCQPPRQKPAPRRRRGESSLAWAARRHASLLEGCKIPDVDWETTRAIAISEFDKVCDIMESLRTQPEIFIEATLRRSQSTILSPGVLHEDQETREFTQWHDAVRSRTYVFTVAHATWKDAAELFEHLARTGLTTASSIEREYKKNDAFMWRLVMCFAKVDFLGGLLWGHLQQILSWTEHFRPYCKRWRSQDGRAHVERNKAYIAKAGFEHAVDELVVRSICEHQHAGAFYNNLTTLLAKDPSQAKKFNAEAFDAMGDLAIVNEFMENVRESAFGQALRAHMKSLLAKDSAQNLGPYRHICSIDPGRLKLTKQPERSFWGHAYVVVDAAMTAWLGVTGSMNVGAQLDRVFMITVDPRAYPYLPLAFDELWDGMDKHLWHGSLALDIPGQAGTVAGEFGLTHPKDPRRPSYMQKMLRLAGESAERETQQLRAQTTPAPAQAVHVPPVASVDSTVKSGHAYVKEMGTKESKSKTRASVPEADTSLEQVDEEPGEERLEDFPLDLPPEFKLGRKVLKIFAQILDPDPGTQSDENAPRKGQIRWGDFEKAMRRIGFAVIQTAGSSVRFDPPAQTARPISFHRPHPDPVLSPILIRWIGGRLRRCYGWTQATFSRLDEPNVPE